METQVSVFDQGEFGPVETQQFRAAEWKLAWLAPYQFMPAVETQQFRAAEWKLADIVNGKPMAVPRLKHSNSAQRNGNASIPEPQ